MRYRNFRNIIFLAVSLLILQSQTARAAATTIDPLIWEQMALDSAFVGIAECEAAGGIVARYRVVESWKGMPVGTRFNLRVATNYWGPQFPITLVGERYLITAYASHAPTTMMSTTSGSPVPLWWRNIPAEYSLPLWQGRARLPLSVVDRPLASLGSQHTDLNSFRVAVTEILSLSREGREVRLLQALAKKYLFARLDEERNPPPRENRAEYERARAAQLRVQRSSSAREIVSELFSLGRIAPDSRHSIGAVLSQGGGAVTLGLLNDSSFRNTIWEDDHHQRIIAEIRYRLGLTPARAPDAEREQSPTAPEIARMRSVLAAGPDSNQFGIAFESLTRYDPGTVAEYLVQWTNPQRNWSDTDYGYVIGSYFAQGCGRDREAHLQRLLQARDPFIRVAGAVYLAFENRALGMARLEEMSRLPGDPGAWAALNLARRGQKSAVPRALEMFATSGTRGQMSGVPHENLQLRLIVLLSNSAAVSNLPQPVPPDEPAYNADADTLRNYQGNFHRYYTEWWRANEARIQLSDPWLTLLEQQKVD